MKTKDMPGIIMATVGDTFCPIKVIDTGEFKKIKMGAMTFTISQYYATGLGNLSLMHGEATLGLMKMDTVIINPFERDMALFSYDRIFAMGKDTLILELYDTRIEKRDIGGELEKLISYYSDIPEQSGSHNWYDDIRLKESVRKKGKKDLTPRFDALTEQYLRQYLKLCQTAPECDIAAKKKAASAYTEGLLAKGGPSTDQFVSKNGKDFTEKLFRQVLFGTGNP